MGVEEAVSLFVEYLKSEKRMSEHTLTAYAADLRQWITFMSGDNAQIDLQSVTHFHVRSWLSHLIKEGLNASTVNRKCSTLKSFYKFALKEQWVIQSPMSRVKPPKTGKRLPYYLEEKSVERLFTENFFDDSFEGVQASLILLLFYGTGIRLSELLNLKLSQIDLSHAQVKVLGKRKKERIVPLTSELTNRFLEYFRIRSAAVTPNEYVFCSVAGQPFYPKKIYQLVHDYLSQVCTLEKRSPHILRHTFATHLLNQGADLNAIKELLGHASLAATQVYTHNSIERLKTIYKSKHPRA